MLTTITEPAPALGGVKRLERPDAILGLGVQIIVFAYRLTVDKKNVQPFLVEEPPVAIEVSLYQTPTDLRTVTNFTKACRRVTVL